jgi:GNAT superfamily N-acetyltransferase
MLRLTRHTSAASFLTVAEPWLMRAEAENNLILGFVGAWAQDASFFTAPPYLRTVESDAGVLACAFRSPPHKLALTRTDERRAMALLAADALCAYPDLSIAFGPEPDIDAFAAHWAELGGRPVERVMRSRIYAARAVERTGAAPPGAMRPATAADLDILVPWVSGLFEEIGEIHHPEPAKHAKARIKSGSLFVWDCAGPVSMAGWSGKTANGVRINLVYTPPQLRSRGYARACVAALTELLLAHGNSFCCLYANVANPVSNRIYQQIGYRPVRDVSDFNVT